MIFLLQRYVSELQEQSKIIKQNNQLKNTEFSSLTSIEEGVFTIDDMEDENNHPNSISSLLMNENHQNNLLFDQQQQMMPEPWIDQTLLTLEVLGMMIFSVPSFIKEFQASLLIDLVSPLLPMEVVELSLWLLQHIILKSKHDNEEYLKLVLVLLENPLLSSTLKERVCYAVVELMYSCDKQSKIKENFKDLGGLTILLDLLKTEKEPNLCYTVLHAFGEAITDCEINKLYISESIGFSKLAKLIQSSVVQLDTTLFKIFFEISTKGNLRYIFDDDSYCPVTHSSTVSSIIMDILTPQPLNTKKNQNSFRTLRSRLTSIDTLTASFSSSPTSRYDNTNNTNNNQTLIYNQSLITNHSNTNNTTTTTTTNNLGDSQETNSSESSMIIIDDSSSKDGGGGSININSNSNTNTNNNHLFTSNNNNSTWYSKNHRLRKSSCSIDHDSLIDWTDQSSNYDQNQNSHGDQTTESDSMIYVRPQLIGLKIRNTDAIFMLIDLLPRSDACTQQEVIELLMSLLESNPENKSMIYSTKKFSEILTMACNAPKEVRHDYFNLLALLGSYNIRKNDAIHLLECIRKYDDDNQLLNDDHSFTQMEILFVLHRLSQRKDPHNYFHLGGENGFIYIDLVDRFPSLKTGYTFCCWLKINIFRSNEVGLYSWLDQFNNTIFELYFKKFSYENNTERYCLAVRTQNLPMPSEHFSFDTYVFTELSKWHHIAFVHVKQTVALYIDGILIQKSSSLNYPRTVSKDKALAAKIGYKKSSSSIDSSSSSSSDHVILENESYFCGSISTIRFVEGALPESIIRNLYAHGSSSDISVNDIGSDQKEFLVIDPSLISNKTTINSPSSSSNNNQNQSEHKLFSSSSSNVNKNNNKKDKKDHHHNSSKNKEDLICKSPDKYPRLSKMNPQNHKIFGDVSIHITNSLKKWALEIQLFSYCIDFMKKGENEQVAALSIICLMLQKHKTHRKAFHDMNGYSILYYLLQKFDLSMEIFDILLDILCDGAILHHQYTFIDEDCAALIFNLLLHAKGIHKRILSHIDHMLLRNNSNVCFLLRAVGFYPILELQGKLTNLEGTPLFHISARMFRGHPTIYQAEEIFNYILTSASDIDSNIERKTKILHHLQVALTFSPCLVEYLKDFYILFALLNSKNEGIRLITINLFGILLDASINSNDSSNLVNSEISSQLDNNDGGTNNVTGNNLNNLNTNTNNSNGNNNNNNFTRLLGYHRIKNILQKYPVTIATCAQLLDYSIGTFQYRGESTSSSSSSMNKKGGYKKSTSISPRNSWNANFTFTTQRMDLKSENRTIVHPETFLVLLGILKNSKNPVAKIQTLTHIEELLHLDENKEQLWKYPWLEWCALFMTNEPHDPDTRSLLDSIIQKMMLYELSLPKTTRFLQLKEMVHNEPFQIHILEVLIEYFDENPCLQPNVASEIIKSLRLLYKDIEYIEGAGVVCMKTLNHINLLAYQNTAEIRAQMKTHGLFDVRDNLIFHLLRGISDQDTTHFIQTFSFHSIANQQKFRENKGIAYLLKWFHHLSFPTNSSASQELLVFIYRILCGVFGPIEENKKIIVKILGDQRICDFFFRPSLLLGRTGEEEDEDIDKSIFEEAFFSWYFAEERDSLRNEIQQRIHKILNPIEAKFEAKADKVKNLKVFFSLLFTFYSFLCRLVKIKLRNKKNLLKNVKNLMLFMKNV